MTARRGPAKSRLMTRPPRPAARRHGPAAIDAVCNLWTPDVMKTRPLQLNARLRHFYEGYLGRGLDLLDGIPLTRTLAEMDAAGVERALLISAALDGWAVPYEAVAETVRAHPGRFAGIAGIDPRQGMRGVRELERAVRTLGFVGAHVYPHWFGLPPDDKHYYPFYAKCVELGIPIEIQIGHSAQTFLRTVAHPMTLDEVAIDFPDLAIVGIHIGWPWVTEAIAVALKHPNVYLAADAHAPKYWDPPFLQFVRTRGRRKVLFGTDYPIMGFERMMREIADHDLDPEARAALLRENAIRVFRLRTQPLPG